MAAFPCLLRPTESPVAQRLAATKEWRPGRRRATRLPTEERATQCARQSSAWVRVTAASKARRTGAVELHLYAASYGRRLLSKACQPPSPSDVFLTAVPPSWSRRVNSEAPVTTACGGMSRRTSWWIAVMTALCPQVRPERRERLPLGLLTFLSLPVVGCGGNSRTGPNFRFALPRARNTRKVLPRTLL